MTQRQTTSSKAEHFTWGIELELYLPRDVIERLGIQIGSYHHGHPLPAPFPAGWTAERDGSLHTDRPNMVPVEIVSPILSGATGIAQVKQVAQTLRSLGAQTNKFCGLHYHCGIASVVGSSDTDAIAAWVGKLLYQTAMHETALYASTGTHRREQGSYARSIKGNHKELADDMRKAHSPQAKRQALNRATSGARYHSLNLTNVFSSKGTVEGRWAAGSVSWEKIIGHLQCFLALCERATETTRMDWNAVASERTYASAGKGQRALDRLFYLTGWTLGRRQVGQPEVSVQGWIGDLSDLAAVKARLRKLAQKYDGQPA